MRHRRERAGASHLHLDALDRRGGLPRRVLVGDRPARRLGGIAELALLVDGIDLDDDAVDLVRQLVAARSPTPQQKASTSSMPLQSAALRIDFEAQARQLIERFPVAVEGRLAVGEQEVGVEIEAARRGDLRLEHAQRSGGGIARIGEAGEAALVALGIQALEGAAVHHGFAADFEGRQIGLDAAAAGSGWCGHSR